MAKKGLILILITIILLTLTSCGLDYRYSLDEDLHDQIECVWGEDNPSYIIYQNVKYIFVGTTNLFHVDTYKVDVNHYKSYDDILLSWNGYRYIWYIDEYYSYTQENPLFIYNKRIGDVYFREDYNYFSDTFVIGNTTDEIVWENIFDSKQDKVDFVNSFEIELYSKQSSRVRTYLKLACVENQWYISMADSKEVWTPSDEFIKILLENALI